MLKQWRTLNWMSYYLEVENKSFYMFEKYYAMEEKSKVGFSRSITLTLL